MKNHCKILCSLVFLLFSLNSFSQEKEQEKPDTEAQIMFNFVPKHKDIISKIKQVSTSKNNGMDEQKIRVIKFMPSWKPSIQNGYFVSIKLNLPTGVKSDE